MGTIFETIRAYRVDSAEVIDGRWTIAMLVHRRDVRLISPKIGAWRTSGYNAGG